MILCVLKSTSIKQTVTLFLNVFLPQGSRAASALTAGTFTSLGGSSSRRGSGETSITVDAETSIREIKVML